MPHAGASAARAEAVTDEEQSRYLEKVGPRPVGDEEGPRRAGSEAAPRRVRAAVDRGEPVELPRVPIRGVPIRGGVQGRRTVTITGRGAERYRPTRPRRQQALHERSGFRPDRAAMWAVLLGVLLILVAATSSHAAQPAIHAIAAHAHQFGAR